MYDSLWNRLLQIKAGTGGPTCGNAACSQRRAGAICSQDTYNLFPYSSLVANEQRDTLQREHRDHLLTGNLRGHRECHVDLTKDWIMRYLVEGDKAVFERTGAHKEVLGKR